MFKPLLALALATAAGAAFSQEPPKPPESPKFYKIEFVVKEVEGSKILNARSYAMTLLADGKDSASTRTGTRIQFQSSWFEVGVNVDCRNAREVQRGELALYVTADISSLGDPSGPNGQPPVRQNRWSSSVVVPIRKPTVIFSSDDLVSKRQMQLELTATPIN